MRRLGRIDGPAAVVTGPLRQSGTLWNQLLALCGLRCLTYRSGSLSMAAINAAIW